jgi:hypothetical protein
LFQALELVAIKIEWHKLDGIVRIHEVLVIPRNDAAVGPLGLLESLLRADSPDFSLAGLQTCIPSGNPRHDGRPGRFQPGADPLEGFQGIDRNAPRIASGQECLSVCLEGAIVVEVVALPEVTS